jgi:23S rRNA (uracil1939-C5)-methyltransferase
LARRGRREPQERAPARALTVRIETIGSGGDGVARGDEGPVYVPLTAPGDLVTIEARGERGRIVELVEASPSRAAPPCRHFGDCGGCAFQHLSRAAERTWKAAQVTSALARLGVAADRINPLLSFPAASRRRAVFSVRRAKMAATLGFNERRSDRIIDIAECPVLTPLLAARLPSLRMVASSIPADAFDLAATACDNGLDVNIASPRLKPFAVKDTQAMRAAGVLRLSLNGDPIMALGEPVVAFDGVAVTPPPGAFLQASREGEAALIGLVKGAAGGARKIADLFSGCGTFSLPLAKSASVTALDSDRPAIGALKRAAAAAQSGPAPVNPVLAETRDLFERPLSARALKPFDAVVFDPPRAGAAAQAAEIAKSEVPAVIGVSCNPQTFARDAGLLAAGGYRLIEVTPVDQFVYSPHVELVGVFAKR